jgi:hypothetical protein
MNGWWHPKHHSCAGRNTSNALQWLIRKVHENRPKRKHTAVLMVDISAAFPNTSKDEVKETLKDADPAIAQWVDTWLANRQISMELDGNRGSPRDAGSGLPRGSPLSPVLFGLTCGRILRELPEGCSYVDDCAWTIPFNNLDDKNELGSKFQRLLDQIQEVFRRHGTELDEIKPELAVIYKANQKRKQWEIDANRWSMRWHGKMIQFNRGSTRWVGYHLDRCMNWHAHVDIWVKRALRNQQQIRRFIAAHGINRKLARTISWSTTMATATYGLDVIYEGQQWIVDQIHTVAVQIARDTAGFKATTVGCDAIRSADIPPTRAILDRCTERLFLRILTQNISNSDLIPDEPDCIVDEQYLPILDRWTERTADGLWVLGDEVRAMG